MARTTSPFVEVIKQLQAGGGFGGVGWIVRRIAGGVPVEFFWTFR